MCVFSCNTHKDFLEFCVFLFIRRTKILFKFLYAPYTTHKDFYRNLCVSSDTTHKDFIEIVVCFLLTRILLRFVRFSYHTRKDFIEICVFCVLVATT